MQQLSKVPPLTDRAARLTAGEVASAAVHQTKQRALLGLQYEGPYSQQALRFEGFAQAGPLTFPAVLFYFPGKGVLSGWMQSGIQLNLAAHPRTILVISP